MTGRDSETDPKCLACNKRLALWCGTCADMHEDEVGRRSGEDQTKTSGNNESPLRPDSGGAETAPQPGRKNAVDPGVTAGETALDPRDPTGEDVTVTPAELDAWADKGELPVVFQGGAHWPVQGGFEVVPALERFERAKKTWKEVTGEDVAHLRCPAEAKCGHCGAGIKTPGQRCSNDAFCSPEGQPSAFQQRHLKCSMFSSRRVYKHDQDCKHQSEEYEHGIGCPCPACVAQTKAMADERASNEAPTPWEPPAEWLAKFEKDPDDLARARNYLGGLEAGGKHCGANDPVALLSLVALLGFVREQERRARERAPIPEGQEERICSRCGCEHRCGTQQVELAALRKVAEAAKTFRKRWNEPGDAVPTGLFHVLDELASAKAKPETGGSPK